MAKVERKEYIQQQSKILLDLLDSCENEDMRLRMVEGILSEVERTVRHEAFHLVQAFSGTIDRMEYDT